MLSRIKKDDLVVVISGKDKGKEGNVLRIDRKKDKALIKGLGMITRHVKPRRSTDKGGIIKEESYIPLSKVMPVCSHCKKRCRVQVQQKENEAKVRMCHRCQNEL